MENHHSLFMKILKSKWTKRAGLVLGSLVFSLLALEALFRIFDPLGAVYHREIEVHFRHTVPDPDFGMIHPPNTKGRSQGADYRINNEGFRGPDIPAQKAPDEKRLIILGDSIVFSWGVDEDKTFWSLIQQKLREANRNWRVIPIGILGWNTRNEYEYMKKRGFELEPDAILLLILPNDVIANYWGRSDVPKEKLMPHMFQPAPEPKGLARIGAKLSEWKRAIIRQSYLLISVQHHIAGMRASGTIKNSFVEESPQWQDQKAALLDLIADCKERDIELAVVLHELVDLSDDSYFKSAMKPILQAHNIPYTKTPDAVFQLKNYLSIIDNHPNIKGHALMAKAYYDFLTGKSGIVPDKP
ncbi:MAG: SGNH/GDSL hydrolase family protein [Candidatus Sumerlaeia bacterium]